MKWLVGCVLMVVVLLPCGAEALESCGAGAQHLERVEFEGLSATSVSTVLELLPREPPSSYSRLELEEFERRLNNLGIFDAVDVACGLGSLGVRVREKWTLVPEVDFATGRTFADTYALAGVTEYNFLGTADTLSLNVFLEQRGFGGKIAFNEHDYGRRGWSLGSSLSLATAEFRFEDETGWRTTSATLELTARSPPWLHEYFNYLAGFYGSSESVYQVRGVRPPPSTQMAQSFMAFSWDSYEWHDLVPSGVQSSIWLSIGGLFGRDPPKPRHTAELLFRGAIPLGAQSVILSRLEAAIGTRGNVNYSFPLGSVSGVRGLPDATYFNWAQAYANVELRHSFQLWPRWALQLVGLLDTAAFEPLRVSGGRGRGDIALSLGMGVRVVPTWISSIALRLDGARLLAPDGSWFAQLGLNQYF